MIKKDCMRPGTIFRLNMLKPIFNIILKDVHSKIILDLGCYDGTLLSEISQKIKCDTFGIDLDKSGLRKALKKDIKVILADGTKLPIKSSSIDYVLCLDIIEHVQQDEMLLNEIFRVLKEEGCLILTTPQKDIKIMPWSNMLEIHKAWGHVRDGYSIRNITQKLETCHLMPFQVIYGSGTLARISYWLLFMSFFAKLPFINKIRYQLFGFVVLVDNHFASNRNGLEIAIIAKKYVG